MLTLIAIIHCVMSCVLVALILLQDSKGGAMGLLGGGGGSNNVFGSTGAADFLVKATRVVAVIFAGTCISLAYLTTTKNSGSVFDNATIDTPATGTTSDAKTPAKTALDKVKDAAKASKEAAQKAASGVADKTKAAAEASKEAAQKAASGVADKTKAAAEKAKETAEGLSKKIPTDPK